MVGNPDGEGYEEYRSYNVLGVLEPGRFVVINVGRYVGRQVRLVSLDDGAVHEINGIPLVSPDKKRILVYSMDIDANYDSNFLAIFRELGSRLEREFLLSGDNDVANQWGPEGVRWLSSSKIFFRRATHSSNGGYASEPLELVLHGVKWSTIQQSNSSLPPTIKP